MTPHGTIGEKDMSPEAVIAQATAARGDIFPEWKILAHAAPLTYDLVTRTGGYFHQYQGQTTAEQQLSGPMRELIATPALCAKGDFRHAPNHIRRMYRMGLTNRVIMEAAAAFSTVSGWSTIANVGFAIMEAMSSDYPFGKLPDGGEPQELTPFPELSMGRARRGAASMLDTREWRYAAGIDAESARRATGWVDHCLLADGPGTTARPGSARADRVAPLAARRDRCGAALRAPTMRHDPAAGLKRLVRIPMTACVRSLGLRACSSRGREAQRQDKKGSARRNSPGKR